MKTNLQPMSTRAKMGWISVFPLFVLLLLIVYGFAPLLLPAQEWDPTHKIFIRAVAGWCFPKPLENLRYLLFLVGIPGSLYVISFFARERVIKSPFVLGAQVFVFSGVVFNFIYQLLYIHPFFFDFKTGVTLILVVGFLWQGGFSRWEQKFQSRPALGYLLAALFTLGEVLPSLVTPTSFQTALSSFIFHLPAFTGEMAPVVNGRTPLVDFFPQYQNLLSLLLLPYFKAFGFSLLTFSIGMMLLTGIGMFFIFDVFFVLTESVLGALLLYFPWVIFSIYVVERSGSHYGSILTHFAIIPMRVWGPWVVFFFSARYFKRPTLRKEVILFYVASLASINNLDFGIPALGATLIAVLLTQGEWLKKIGVFVCSYFFGWLSFGVMCWMRVGKLPELQQIFMYQKIFAIHGFNMLPTPLFGIHWIMALVWLVSLLMGMISASESRKVESASLIQYGIFGLGAFTYYLGRSAWSNVLALFPAFGMSFLLVSWSVYQRVRNSWKTWSREERSLWVLPSIFLVLGYSILLSDWVDLPNPMEQIQSLAGSRETVFDPNWVKWIQASTQPGEKVAIIAPYAHEIALLAQVENVYPFAFDGSIIILPQIDLLMRKLDEHGVKKIFGQPPQEVRDRIELEGFKWVRPHFWMR